MALTQGTWSETSLNGSLILECDVTATVAENDGYTLKTPDSLDTSRPWTLVVNATDQALDAAGTACPVHIWGGYANDFALTGDGASVAATSGFKVGSSVMDKVQAVQCSVIVDPNYTGAKVQSTDAGVVGIVNCGTHPNYVIHYDGGSTLAAKTCKIIIVQ
jgi:hypothetical protein